MSSLTGCPVRLVALLEHGAAAGAEIQDLVLRAEHRLELVRVCEGERETERGKSESESESEGESK